MIWSLITNESGHQVWHMHHRRFMNYLRKCVYYLFVIMAPITLATFGCDCGCGGRFRTAEYFSTIVVLQPAEMRWLIVIIYRQAVAPSVIEFITQTLMHKREMPSMMKLRTISDYGFWHSASLQSTRLRKRQRSNAWSHQVLEASVKWNLSLYYYCNNRFNAVHCGIF